MLKTVEGVVDAQNNIRLLEDVPLKPAQRVLVTILDTESVFDTLLRELQSPEKKAAGLTQFDQLQSRLLELRDDEGLSEADTQEEINTYRREKKVRKVLLPVTTTS
jgi:hypothetical protein